MSSNSFVGAADTAHASKSVAMQSKKIQNSFKLTFNKNSLTLHIGDFRCTIKFAQRIFSFYTSASVQKFYKIILSFYVIIQNKKRFPHSLRKIFRIFVKHMLWGLRIFLFYQFKESSFSFKFSIERQQIINIF